MIPLQKNTYSYTFWLQKYSKLFQIFGKVLQFISLLLNLWPKAFIVKNINIFIFLYEKNSKMIKELSTNK